MTKECCGLFGKCFGHKFKSYKTEILFTVPINHNMNGNNNNLVIDIEQNRAIYIICCTRCGMKVDNE